MLAKLTAGGTQIDYMSLDEIQAREKISKNHGPDSPWVKHWDEQARKTVIHHGSKLLRQSPDLVRAQDIAERTETGEGPEYIIDVEPEDIDMAGPFLPAGSQDLQDAVAEKKIEDLKSSAETARRKEGKADKSGGEKQPDGPNPDSGAPAGPGVAAAPIADRPLTPAENRALDAEILKQDEKKAATGAFSPNFRFGRR